MTFSYGICWEQVVTTKGGDQSAYPTDLKEKSLVTTLSPDRTKVVTTTGRARAKLLLDEFGIRGGHVPSASWSAARTTSAGAISA